MGSTAHRDESRKAVILYLLFTLGVCFLLGALAIILSGKAGNSIFVFLQKIFTPIPVLAALLTRILLKDKSSWKLDLRVWRNKKALLLSALLPGAAIVLGAALYYAIFPNELSANVQSIFDFCVPYGLPAGLPVNRGTIALAALVLWLASVLAIPIHLLELGEEVGWRGYLLPKMLSFMSVKKAVLANGALWGLAHAPLIFFGFNYGTNYWGTPITGILMMTISCIGAGICMSYSMIKTNNCMYAAIIHGAINVAADMQILSVAVNKPLLGPTPTGIIGMSIVLAISAFIFFRKLDSTVS